MQPDQLERLRAAAAEVIETLFAADPEGAVGGGAGGLPHRYSFGATSATRHMFHRPEWCELLDMPTTTPILTAIFGSPNYIVYGCGGDLALPGAIEYQGLHSDNVWSELHDPVGGVTMRDLPVPSVHINFPLVDLTPENGPIRQIPGTHRSRAPIPRLADEPEWMRLSTVCPLPAGSAIFRDARCWHGGTPNLSREVRAMPNVEYFAPWFRSEALIRSMSYDDMADAVAARPADLPLRRVRPGRGGGRRGLQPSRARLSGSATARHSSSRWGSIRPRSTCGAPDPIGWPAQRCEGTDP